MPKTKETKTEEKETEKKEHFSGVPMSEQSYKEWQKAFTDMEECIKSLK